QPIREEVRFYTEKILNYLQTNKWYLYDPPGNLVPLGSDATFFSYPILRAGEKIMGKKVKKKNLPIYSKPIWAFLSALEYMPDNPLHNEVNRSMLLALMSMTENKNYEKMEALCRESGAYLFLLAEAFLQERKLPEPYRAIFLK